MASKRRTIPFWLHQALEYLLGGMLAFSAVGMAASAGALLIGAAVLVAVAAASDGPLGCWSLLGRAGHRHADFVIVASFAVAPLLLRRPGASLWIVAELVAAGLAAISRATIYVKPPGENRAKGAKSATVDPADAVPASVPRRLGAVAGRWRNHGPRALGRVVGRRKANGQP